MAESADTLCMSGLPAPVARAIARYIEEQQGDDAQLADLAANLTATAAQLNAAATIGATTSTAAELNMLDNILATVSWAVTAGAANVAIFTGTVKDAAGATIAAPCVLDVYISEAATGIGVSADSYSTGASVTTGTQLIAQTANKAWTLITTAGGVFAISITDTAKPADQYLVAVNPKSGAPVVSAASSTTWGA